MNNKPINQITQDDVNWFRECRENQHHQNNFDVYQQIATKSANYPGKGSPLGLVYLSLKNNGEAGECAEQIGKAMRDDVLIPVGYSNNNRVAFVDKNPLNPERRAAIIKELGDQLWYIAAQCNELETTLSEVAQANLQKLADRTARNTLQGSGDDR